MSWIRRNLKIVLPLAVVGLVAVAVLAFGVFGVHTLFLDDEVDESGPVFDSGVAAAAAPVDTMAPDAEEEPTAGTDPATRALDPTADLAPGTPEPAAPATTESPVVTEPAAPQIVSLAEGSFIPRGRYSGEGRAVVLNDGSEQRFLRFENFATDNGPDLRVYLSASSAEGDSGAFDDDFVDLGVLKGNIGDQNYEIPVGVDLSVYDTVVVWCVRFSTPFTAADLI
jgi:hypothetical protein